MASEQNDGLVSEYSLDVQKALQNLKQMINGINEFKTATANAMGSSAIETTKFLNSMSKTLTVIDRINKSNLSGLDGNMLKMVDSAKTLGSELSKMNGKESISEFSKNLSSLPRTLNKINALDFNKLKTSFQTLTDLMTPFINKIKTVGEELKDLNNLASGLKNITSSAKTVDNYVNKSKNSGGGSLTNLVRNINAVGAIRILTNGIKRLWDMTSGLVHESINYIEALNLFQVSMDAINDDTDGFYTRALKFQHTLEENYGTFITETMNYQSIFNEIAKNIGISKEYAYEMSEILTKVSLDLSSLYNVEQGDMFEKMQSAITGQTRPLRSATGIDITMNTLKDTLKDLKIDLDFSELTQAEKMVLRYITVVKNASSANGDFANTIEEPAQQLKMLQNQIKGLGLSIGNVFIGIFSKILPYINAVVMVIKILIDMLAGFFGYTEDLGSSIRSVNSTPIDLGTEDELDKAKKLKQIMFGFDELNVINKDSGGGDSNGALGGGVNPELLKAMDEIYANYNKKLEEVKNQATEIRDKIMEWLGFTKVTDEATGKYTWKLKDGYTNLEKIRDILIAIVSIFVAGKILTGIINIVKWCTELKSAFSAIAGSKIFTSLIGKTGILSKSITGLGSAFAGLSAPVIAVIAIVTALIATFIYAYNNNENFKASVDRLLSSIKEFALVLAESIQPIIQLIGNVVVEIYELIKPIIEWVVKIIYEILKLGLLIAIETITTAIRVLTKLLQGDFKGAIQEVIDGNNRMKEHFAETGTAIVNATQEMREKVIQKFKEWGQNLLKFVTEEIPKIIEKIITFWRELPSKIGYAIGFVLGTLIRWVADMIIKVKEEVPKVIQKIITYWDELPSKVWNALIKIRGKISELWDNFKIWWGEFFTLENLAKLGQAILDGIINGMMNIGNKFKEFGEGFIQGLKDALGIHSPSKLAKDEVGVYIGEGILIGMTEAIENGIPKITDIFKELSNDIEKTFEGITYNPNIDYQDLINKAKEAGDFSEASRLEVIRNTKIKGEGLDYALTYDFQNMDTSLSDISENTIEVIKQIEDTYDNGENNEDIRQTEMFNKLNSITTNIISRLKEIKNSCDNIRINIHNNYYTSAKGYATGGMPNTGEIYFARENGISELIGSIGNKSTVMNNEQIVDAVARGVATAVSSVMSKEDRKTVIQIDGKTILTATEEAKRVKGYNIVGGAFA